MRHTISRSPTSRRRQALNWRCARLGLIKASPVSSHKGFGWGLVAACISSGFSTVIQKETIAHLDHNWFNEPSAVSPGKLPRRAVLRHAWLSLWYKHIDTGRINQLSTVKRCYSFLRRWRDEEAAVPTSREDKHQHLHQPRVTSDSANYTFPC